MSIGVTYSPIVVQDALDVQGTRIVLDGEEASLVHPKDAAVITSFNNNLQFQYF